MAPHTLIIRPGALAGTGVALSPHFMACRGPKWPVAAPDWRLCVQNWPAHGLADGLAGTKTGHAGHDPSHAAGFPLSGRERVGVPGLAGFAPATISFSASVPPQPNLLPAGEKGRASTLMASASNHKGCRLHPSTSLRVSRCEARDEGRQEREKVPAYCRRGPPAPPGRFWLSPMVPGGRRPTPPSNCCRMDSSRPRVGVLRPTGVTRCPSLMV